MMMMLLLTLTLLLLLLLLLTLLLFVLDAMMQHGVTVALLARISTGIYAGPHRKRVNREFETIVNELLSEKVGKFQEPRGKYFKRVCIPMLK